MIRFERTEVVGWEHAIRGMRNPMNSWDQSDSLQNECTSNCVRWEKCGAGSTCPIEGAGCDFFSIGKNDFDLMTRLRNAGTDHRKFMRMLAVYVDITAPLYWWKEFDTYKVGTVANSCSTMHKIHAKEFTLDDFSFEHIEEGTIYSDLVEDILICLNEARNNFVEDSDKTDWWQLIQLLPTSYNQKRTVMLNYEVLANIYKSRKNHKLDEWRDLCSWIEALPYSELITGCTEQKRKGEQNERTEDNSGIGQAHS